MCGRSYLVLYDGSLKSKIMEERIIKFLFEQPPRDFTVSLVDDVIVFGDFVEPSLFTNEDILSIRAEYFPTAIEREEAEADWRVWLSRKINNRMDYLKQQTQC